jgi:hypothetical protein
MLHKENSSLTKQRETMKQSEDLPYKKKRNNEAT